MRIARALLAGGPAFVLTAASLLPADVPLLEPGSPGVDASAIAPSSNLIDVVEVKPDGTDRRVGTWDDRVEIVKRDGRVVLRRIQNSKTATGTSAHLDEVDQRTLQPIRARYESNGAIVSDASWDGPRLTARDITTPAGPPGSTERIPVTLRVEFP